MKKNKHLELSRIKENELNTIFNLKMIEESEPIKSIREFLFWMPDNNSDNIGYPILVKANVALTEIDEDQKESYGNEKNT